MNKIEIGEDFLESVRTCREKAENIQAATYTSDNIVLADVIYDSIITSIRLIKLWIKNEKEYDGIEVSKDELEDE